MVAVCVLLYTVFLRDLGFLISTSFDGLFLRVLETSAWKKSLFAALATTVGFYLVFQVWLQAQLPKGPLGSEETVMEIIRDLIFGFSVTLQPANLLMCFIGVLLGTLVGVLPGLGPVAAMSLLLPTTFSVSPVGAVIMLSGIYYGAMYGGSTTSILLNIPGESASVVTCLDGYQMARQGRAGPALGMSAMGLSSAGASASSG